MRARPFKSFLVSLLLVAPGAAFAQSSAPRESARPTVLYISIEDNAAITREGRELMMKYLATVLPDHDLALVQSSGARHKPDEEKIRKELSIELERALRDRGPITHLIISTHGATAFSDDNSRTRLQSMGAFNEQALDAKLASLLAPLRGRLASGANVILDSCSTMCGTDSQTRARAATLMNFLGATDGVLYGARTPEVDVMKMGPQARTWARLKPKLSFLRTVFLLSMAGVAPMAWWGYDGTQVLTHVSNHLQTGLVSGALMTFMLRYLEPAFIWAYEKMHSINQGHLFALRQGEVMSQVPIEKRLETLGSIFRARSCHRIFAD